MATKDEVISQADAIVSQSISSRDSTIPVAGVLSSVGGGGASVVIPSVIGAAVMPSEIKPKANVVVAPPVEEVEGGSLVANPGSEGSMVEKSSVISLLVHDLLSSAATSVAVDAGLSATMAAATQWRAERVTIKGSRNGREVTRYPGLGCFGVSRHAYNYLDGGATAAARRQVRSHRAYDADLRWRAIETDVVPRHPLVMQENVAKALAQTEDRIDMLSKMTRMRGWFFEGKVALSLAETMIDRAVGRGFSAFAPLARLVGYELSVSLPADDGLLGTASIPADAPLHYGAAWWPGHPGTGGALMGCDALFTSGVGFRDWLNGQAVIAGPANYRVADLGSRVLAVPVPLSYVKQARSLTWLALSFLQYPFKNVSRRGVLRDWNGDLIDVAAQPARPCETDWMPASTLVSIQGPVVPTAAGTSMLIMFVLTEDYTTQPGGLQLSFTAAGGPVVLPLGPVSQPVVPWAPVLTQLAADPPGGEVQHIVEAQRLLFSYMGAGLDQADVVRFWQSTLHLSAPAPEGCGVSWRSVIAPAHSDARRWVHEPSMLASSTVRRRSAPYIPVNSLFAWPGFTFSAVAGDLEAAGAAYHFEVPAFDCLLAVGLAFGIVHLTTPRPEGSEPAYPSRLLPWVMGGAFRIAAAVDVMLVANGAARSYLWYASNVAVPAHVSAALMEAQDGFWGRAGGPTLDSGAPMGPALSALLFSGRVKVWHPSNGVVLANRVNDLPDAYRHSGSNLLARIDLPTLCQFTSVTELSSSSDIDLTGFPAVPLMRDAQRMRRDMAFAIPDSAEPDGWLKGWQLAVQLDGVFANGLGQGEYGALRQAGFDLMQVQESVPVPQFGPLTWGALLSIAPAAEVQGMIAYEPSDWGLTVGRPLGSHDPRYAQDLRLVVRDRTLVFTPSRYAAYKPAYYVPTVNDKWSALYSTSKSSVRRRTFKV